MKRQIKKIINQLLDKWGYSIINRKQISLHDEHQDREKELIYLKVKEFTMTSFQRIGSIVDAINYLNQFSIQGDIVECGVWRGGSTMAAMLTLSKNHDLTRDIYLYDTYEGMSEPTSADINRESIIASTYLNNIEKSENDMIWAYSSLDEVKRNVHSTRYPSDKIHFIKGKVEETLPKNSHSKIALLRLDTDWYESTKCELENLYPLLVDGGVLIIDDYGEWKGCKKAVDEYIKQKNICIFFMPIDYTGRIAIKQSVN